MNKTITLLFRRSKHRRDLVQLFDEKLSHCEGHVEIAIGLCIVHVAVKFGAYNTSTI